LRPRRPAGVISPQTCYPYVLYRAGCTPACLKGGPGEICLFAKTQSWTTEDFCLEEISASRGLVSVIGYSLPLSHVFFAEKLVFVLAFFPPRFVKGPSERDDPHPPPFRRHSLVGNLLVFFYRPTCLRNPPFFFLALTSAPWLVGPALPLSQEIFPPIHVADILTPCPSRR